MSKKIKDLELPMPIRYERNQKFNSLVSYLHGIRYKHLLDSFNILSKKYPDKIFNIIDIGCAHAKAYESLRNKFNFTYIGIELNYDFYVLAKDRYGDNKNFKILNGSVELFYDEINKADIVIALETFEHIPENIVVRVIEKIAQSNPLAFICSVPNEIGPILLIKNIGSFISGYVRHREYRWIETIYAALYQLDKIEAHKTGHKGFDWRWLAQTIRHNMKISKIHSSPFKWLPKFLSFSIIFICYKSI